MKRQLFVLAVCLCTLSVQASVSIRFYAGPLLDHEGQLIADGSLMQLITRTVSSSGFSVPTTADFIGSEETIVSAFGMDSETTEEAGEIFTEMIFDLSGGIAQGQELILRWWPTLTLADTNPLFGSHYGEYRTDALADGSNIAWEIPSDGSYTLSFVADTTSGLASLQVIPEPSTYALTGVIGLAGLIALRRRRS